MAWVLDASVALAWCFEDEWTPHSEGLFDRLRVSPAIVPQIWPLEVANVLVQAVRRGTITPGERAEFLELLDAHPIEIDSQTSEHAFGSIIALADRHHLTTHDASYLELAMRLGVPLATLDTQLRAAAGSVGVTLL